MHSNQDDRPRRECQGVSGETERTGRSHLFELAGGGAGYEGRGGPRDQRRGKLSDSLGRMEELNILL